MTGTRRPTALPASAAKVLGAAVGLQRIVDAHVRERVATFCVMLADRGDKNPLAFAIWRQRRLLYRWRQTNAPQLNDAALVLHAPLDLRKDIVRTPADEASTYRVTKAWVRMIDARRREDGQAVQIIRRGAK